MIDSSATAGQPVSPSRAETTPSFICAPSVSRGSWACWAMTPSNALTYSSARRISTASLDAHAVVGENPYAGGRVGHRAELGELLPRQADGHRADRGDVAVAGLAAEPPDLLDHAGGVGDRVGVGHRVHGGEPAERRGPGAGHDRLGVLASGLAQVGVQVDEAGKRDEPGGVDDLGARRGLQARSRPRRPSAGSSRSAGSPPSRRRAADQRWRRDRRGRPSRRLAPAEQQVEHRHPDGDAVGDLLDDHRAQRRRRRRR